MSLESRLSQITSVQGDEYLGLLHLIGERNQGRLIECLDDGFVRLVDHMGDDAAIVQAARVSYGAGTKKVSDDRNLIRYLMRHWHTTPFEMVEIKFHVRVPMDCWRQWVRHRMASINEYSTRYSEAIDSQQTTAANQWRLQATNNKQGSGGLLVVDDGGAFCGEVLSEEEAYLHKLSRTVYEHRLEAGIAREQARKDLPLSTYTEAYWKIDLHNLFHFLRLRMDSHAQLEIRTYANAIFKLIEPIVPIACEAFRDYRLDAMQLTGPEITLLRSMFSGEAVCTQFSDRERQELNAKLVRLGLNPLPAQSPQQA